MVELIDSFSSKIKINPDFIYNRIDFFSNEFVLLHIQNNANDYYMEMQLNKKCGELGIWMMQVSNEEFEELTKFLFDRFPNIDCLSFYNAISDRIFSPQKHYHVELPKTYELLQRRLSSKSRNTMNRKKKKAEREFGEIRMVEYDNDKITGDIVSMYFKLKERTMHIQYNMTYKSYLEKYHVSNVYILYFGKRVAAMILTCEQCPIVYLENLTYDVCLSWFSPGMIAYDMVLERLIIKGKKFFYLGGGDYDYKKRYGSIETFVTDGKIYRTYVIEMKYKIIDFYNKHLFWKIRKIKRILFS